MFIPAEMSEVDIFVNENDIEAVAQTIASLGLIHLLDTSALGDWATGVSAEWAGRIATYTAQERRLVEIMNQLKIAESTQPLNIQLQPAEDVAVIEEALQQAEARVSALRTQQDKIRRDLEHWELVSKSLQALEPLAISLSDLQHLEHLHVVAGTIPSENLSRLEASLFSIPYQIIPVYHYQNGDLIFAFSSEEHAPILDRALESAFLDPLTLPTEYAGTPQEVLAQVDANMKQGQAQLEEIESQVMALSAALQQELQQLLLRIRGDRAVADAMSHFGHRGHVYLIAGWVPQKELGQLRTAVDQVSEGRATVEENPPYVAGQQHKVPTLLNNRRLFRPAESLVKIYGLPDYNELDPTPLVAITFALMFGMMFGDLGQGLIFILAGIALQRKWIPRLASMASFGAILLACGISSSIFGTLYGSVFGQENILNPLWLRPMDNIWSLLITSIVYGVVVLNIGYILNLVKAGRNKALRDVVFAKNGIVGMALYWCLLLIVFFIMTGKHVPILVDILVPLLCIALLLSEQFTRMLKRQKPAFTGNVGEALLQSFFEFFEAIISYVSNTLSYVRLGAFAVAHMGLSKAFSILAQLISGSTSITISGIFILIIGNIFILALEGLIVGIQTLRLEYYEFFGKFFNGDGIPFKPLTLPSTYVLASRKRSEQA